MRLALGHAAARTVHALGELARSIETGEPLPERLGGAKPFSAAGPPTELGPLTP